MVKNFTLLACFMLFGAQITLLSQTVNVTISGLRPGDSCQVTLQKSEEFFFIQTVKAGQDSSGMVIFKDITKGVW